MFYLMRGDSNADSTAFAPKKAGHSGWNEPVTYEQDSALVDHIVRSDWIRNVAGMAWQTS